MARIKEELHISDLILLKVIFNNPRLTKRQLWTPKSGLWNKALKPLVELGRCAYVSSDHRYAAAIETLRFCNLLTDESPYEATAEAERMFLSLPKSERKWPLLIPLYKNGDRNWDAAQYFEMK